MPVLWTIVFFMTWVPAEGFGESAIPAYQDPESFLTDYENALKHVPPNGNVQSALVEYFVCDSFRRKSPKPCLLADKTIGDGAAHFNCSALYGYGYRTHALVSGSATVESCALNPEMFEDRPWNSWGESWSGRPWDEHEASEKKDMRAYCGGWIKYWKSGDLPGFCRWLTTEDTGVSETNMEECLAEYRALPGDPALCDDFDPNLVRFGTIEERAQMCRERAAFIRAIRRNDPKAMADTYFAPLLDPAADCGPMKAAFLREYRLQARHFKDKPRDAPVAVPPPRPQEPNPVVLSSQGKVPDASVDVRPSKTGPRTILIAAQGGGDYRSWQEAADFVGFGDTVRLGPGEYPTIEINRSGVTIAGENRGSVFVHGIVVRGVSGAVIRNLTVLPAPGAVVREEQMFKRNILMPVVSKPVESRFALAVIDSRNVRLEGLGATGADVGVALDGVAQFELVRSELWDNAVGMLVHRSTGSISRNLIRANRRVHSGNRRISGRGVEIGAGARVEVISNTIVDNTSSVGTKSRTNGRGLLTGIAWANGWKTMGPKPLSFVKVENNIVTGHDIDIFPTPRVIYNAVSVRVLDKNKPTHCFIEIAGHPGHLYQPSLEKSNTFEKPLFLNPEANDYRLRADSPLRNKGRGGTYMGAFAPVSR